MSRHQYEQVIDELESRPQLSGEGRLEEIITHIQGTLLPDPDPGFAQYGAHAHVGEGGDGEAGGDVVMDDEEAEMMYGAGAGMEQEFVTEAEWGRDKEDAVDDEPTGDMD